MLICIHDRFVSGMTLMEEEFSGFKRSLIPYPSMQFKEIFIIGFKITHNYY